MKILHSRSFQFVILALAFFLFSAEECKNKSGDQDTPKTEQPQQPESSTPPEGYEPPVVDTSVTPNTDPDCIGEPETDKFPCPDVYDPVCGCDGKNYANPCQAKRAGVKKWEKGRCN